MNLIMNTLLGEKFREFITECEKEREKHIVMQKQLKVKLVPEIAKIILDFNSISSKAKRCDNP